METGGNHESCPSCGAGGAGVTDSRPHRFGRQRRRRCARCDHRWVTVELPVELLYELERCGGDLDALAETVRALQMIRRQLIGRAGG